MCVLVVHFQDMEKGEQPVGAPAHFPVHIIGNSYKRQSRKGITLGIKVHML